jgi:formylglycine-generating enzyme required for sulfatase activity
VTITMSDFECTPGAGVLSSIRVSRRPLRWPVGIVALALVGCDGAVSPAAVTDAATDASVIDQGLGDVAPAAVDAVDAPAVDAVDAPAVDAVDAPAAAAVDAAAVDAVDAPAVDAVVAPAVDAVDAPAADAVDAPAVDVPGDASVSCSGTLTACADSLLSQATRSVVQAYPDPSCGAPETPGTFATVPATSPLAAGCTRAIALAANARGGRIEFAPAAASCDASTTYSVTLAGRLPSQYQRGLSAGFRFPTSLGPIDVSAERWVWNSSGESGFDLLAGPPATPSRVQRYAFAGGADWFQLSLTVTATGSASVRYQDPSAGVREGSFTVPLGAVTGVPTLFVQAWGNCDTAGQTPIDAQVLQLSASPAIYGRAVCTPGARDCADATTPRVCNADGRGYTALPACVGARCEAGACVPAQTSCIGAAQPGCGLVAIPGGSFDMGAPAPAVRATPVRSVTVGSFSLDAYEVTVARFRAFWEAGRAAPTGPVRYRGGLLAWNGGVTEPVAAPRYGGTCNWTRTAGAREAHPINCVDWYTAQAFCVWDGGRLPTEAEWEYAARGLRDGRTVPRSFPWGDETPAGTSGGSCDRAHFNACRGDDGGSTRRVGSFAATGGLYDLAGNVWEHTADFFADYTNAQCWGVGLRTDPLCAVDLGNHAVRGGWWGNPNDSLTNTANLLRSATRGFDAPTVAYEGLGFRCARDR